MRKILIILLSIVTTSLNAQFNHQDTLRGTITTERGWWDVTHYAVTVEPDFKTKTISGNNIITCKASADGKVMQIDMQSPMEVTSILCEKRRLKIRRDGNVYYAEFPSTVKKGTVLKLVVNYNGRPKEAVNPPWDGGWIWKKDRYGNPWISVACQVLGASVWYPCKDHQSDEPDSASLSIIVPDTLVGVGNGRLQGKEKKNDKTIYTWVVTNPINSYNIIPSIGKYVNWTDTFEGEKGKLDLSYWVLKENEEKGKKQFTQVKPMLKCFEYWFGPYPFYEDGYKLVESPHLGMEHQSGIAYGNKYQNGYLGKDLSNTGWGKKWDFIIIHESGHEWFGNNITTKDVADMWVHEGFTNYSETLFTQCEYGKEAGDEYCRGLRNTIQNDVSLVGRYGVNKEGSGDMYAKGANLLHTLRQIVNDDEKFRSILRGLNKDFYHQTVTSAQVEHYISQHADTDFSKVFDQYLRTTRIPRFEFRHSNNKLSYRWGNCIDGFDMPVKIIAGKDIWLHPTTVWKEMDLIGAFKLDPNFYVNSSKM